MLIIPLCGGLVVESGVCCPESGDVVVVVEVVVGKGVGIVVGGTKSPKYK